MTDFAKLTGQPPAIDESQEAFEVTPEGYENGSGEPLKLLMHPLNGTRHKRAMRLEGARTLKARQIATTDQDDTPPEELTDEALEAFLQTMTDKGAVIFARCCDGWNMTDGKDPIELNIENATALFSQVPSLADVVSEAMAKVGNDKTRPQKA